MANKFQVKRTTVSGRTPNTTNSSNSRYIDTGELALNVPDGKLYSSNGTGYFEIGANLQNLSVAANTVINKLVANGSLGQNTQVLASNGTSTYWTDAVVGELVLTGTDLVTDVFTGNGTNTQFTLSTTPYDESAVTVIIDGVSQHKSAYSVSGNYILFSSAPAVDAEIDVTCYTTATNRLMGIDVSVNTFTGNGSNTQFDLSVTPDSELQIIVVIDGVSQHKSAYTVSGNSLLFSSPPAVDAEIDVTVLATGPIGAGSNTHVMFNDAGALAGVDSFTFNRTSNTLSTRTILLSDNANAASLTVGASFIANSTAIVGTGYANVTTSVNSALLTVGTAFIANTTGAYHTGLIDAASISVGSGSFVANTTHVTISGPLTANGTTGTARNVLASNGAAGSPYWVDFNTEVVYALSGTALDPLNGTIQTKTIAATTTFTDSLTDGQSMVLMLNGGSVYSVIFPTMVWVTAAGNVAPTLTANVALTFWKVSTTLYGSYVGSYA